MAYFTLRIDNTLDNQLNDLAEASGVTKSSLVMYIMNEHLRTHQPITNFKVVTEQTTRLSLRLSDSLNELLNDVSNESGIAKNSIINAIIHHYLSDIWTYY